MALHRKTLFPDPVPLFTDQKPITKNLSNWNNDIAHYFSSQDKKRHFLIWLEQPILILCILIPANVNWVQILSQGWTQSEQPSLFKLNSHNICEAFCIPRDWKRLLRKRSRAVWCPLCLVYFLFYLPGFNCYCLVSGKSYKRRKNWEKRR